MCGQSEDPASWLSIGGGLHATLPLGHTRLLQTVTGKPWPPAARVQQTGASMVKDSAWRAETWLSLRGTDRPPRQEGLAEPLVAQPGLILRERN